MLGWLEQAKKKKDEVLTEDVKTKINTGFNTVSNTVKTGVTEQSDKVGQLISKMNLGNETKMDLDQFLAVEASQQEPSSDKKTTFVITDEEEGDTIALPEAKI